MVYLLRTVPANLVLDVSKMFDANVAACTRALAGGVLPHDVMRELTLPISGDEAYFGICLTASTDIASSTYLASRVLVEPFLHQLLSIPDEATFQTDLYIQDAYADWEKRVDERTPLIYILRSGVVSGF